MKNPSNPRVRSSTSKKPLTYPKGILVLGMHRSGTSAFTRVLNLLGCALPDNLIGAGDGNDTGHWEAVSVVSLNDQIFMSAGSRWDDWGPLNDDWRQSSLRDEMLQKAVTLIEEHVDLGSLFAIKDPRLCRLADVWLAAMEEAKVEPSAVLMVRNPAEVIASLENRDLMAPGYGQLLWLRHALDAEFFSRGSNRIVCRYDQLMTNWFSVIDRVRTGLGITLPRNSTSVHLEIEQYLNGEHRHHEIPAEAVIGNPALSEWLRKTFAIMMRWSEDGEKSSDYAELDKIRLEFDRSYSTFARLLLPDDLAGEPGLGPRMKRELAGQVIAAQTASEEAEGRVYAAAARETELAAEIARLEAATAAANSDVEREAQHRKAIEAQLAEVQHAAQNAQTAFEEAEGRVSAAVAREAELAAEIARLDAVSASANLDVERETQHRQAIEAQLAELAEKGREHELRNAELVGRLAVAESTMIQRQEELAQLLAQFLESEAASAQAIAQGTIAQEQLLDAKQHLAEAAVQFEDLAQRSAAEREAADIKIARLQTEIVQITQMLQKQEEEAKITQDAREFAEEALAAEQEKTNQLDAQLKQLQAAKQSADSARVMAEQKLGDRFTEIARLTTMLADEGAKVDHARANEEWLRSALQLAASFPKWWAMMPQKWRRKREHARYRNSGLLDAESYLEAYPDVAEYGMDPVRHYILHGMAEGRSSSI